jgi:hypothetical protein
LNFNLTMLMKLKWPFFLSSAQATSKRASMTPSTCLCVNIVRKEICILTVRGRGLPHCRLAAQRAFMAFDIEKIENSKA